MYKTTWESLAADANYRPGELARLCHVSLRTLQRHFLREYKMSVRDWLADLRLKRAYARIEAGEPVKVVAYDLCFKQLSHFSRAFKAAHGVPPSLISSAVAARARLTALKTEAAPKVAA